MRALIALVAASALFAADATPAATATLKPGFSCSALGGQRFSAREGVLTFYNGGTLSWMPRVGIQLAGSYTCGTADTMALRLDDYAASKEPDDTATLDGFSVVWRGSSFRVSNALTEPPRFGLEPSAPFACLTLVYHRFDADELGRLEFLPGRRVELRRPGGNFRLGSFHCTSSGDVLLSLDGLPVSKDEKLRLDGTRLVWGDSTLARVEEEDTGKAVVLTPTATPTATPVVKPPVAIAGLPEPCSALVGATLEIQSLEGLPASADRLTGEADGTSPRRPYLILGQGVGNWVNARGDNSPIGWRCDDKALTVTISGNPTVFHREGSGFRFGGAPVRRFIPKARDPNEPRSTCADLAGKAFVVRGGGDPLGGAPKGRGGFMSEDDVGPRPPSLTFGAREKKVDYVDKERRKFTLDYQCDDERGVTFTFGGGPNVLAWDGRGLRWNERLVRPFVAP